MRWPIVTAHEQCQPCLFSPFAASFFTLYNNSASCMQGHAALHRRGPSITVELTAPYVVTTGHTGPQPITGG